MAKQTINIGAIANDNTGDTIRDGGDKINDNFTELYAALFSISTKSANYTLLSTDYVIVADTIGITLTLPTAVGLSGKSFVIKNTSAGSVTVDANGSETIDGNLTQTVNTFDSLTVISNNINWLII